MLKLWLETLINFLHLNEKKSFILRGVDKNDTDQLLFQAA